MSSSTYTPSVIASTGNSLSIGAKGAVTVNGSVVTAAKDVTVSGSSVAFNAEQNSFTQTATHKDKSVGLTGRVSPNSVVGQIINTALAATHTSGKGAGTLAAMDAMQGAYLAGTGIAKGLDAGLKGLTGTNLKDRDAGSLELVGVQAGVGLASNKRSISQTQTEVLGSTASAGDTLSIIARGDNASDRNNGDLSAVATRMSGQDVVLAAQKDMTLSAGWNTTQSESRMSSNNAFVGVDAGVSTSGAGVSVTASVGLQNQHVTTSSRTAVDTTVTAGNSVTLRTPGAMTLDGAEVSGPRIDVSAGSLSIISPQNTSDYKSTARQTGASISVPVWGAGGKVGGGASYSQQNVTDHFATTEDQLSGFYAGSKGLGVDVTGNTTLKAGVLSSMAAADLNHFRTGSLTATGVENISSWEAKQTGASFSAGAGMFGSTTGILGVAGGGLASGASGLMGGGRTHLETSESQSAIGRNITVDAGSVQGSYTTDVAGANAALTNGFDAQKLSNQLLSQQMGSQLVGEVGGQVADRLNKAGVAGFDETNWKDNYGRTLLETAGNAVVAAVTGGNVGAAAAGTAVADEAIAASSSTVALWAVRQTSDPAVQQALVGAVMNGIADAASAAGGAVVGGGSGVTVLNASSMASAVEQNNFAILIPIAIAVAEIAVTAVETGEVAESSAAAVSAVRGLLSAGKSAYTVSQLLSSMGLDGAVLVNQAQSSQGSSTKASSAGNGGSASGGGTAAPEPEEPNDQKPKQDATESPALKDSPYNPDVVNSRVKPPYQSNPAHDTGSPLYNPRKSPEPSDAQSVYENKAIRGAKTETSQKAWYGKGEEGYYRFFTDNAGTAHFSGIIKPSDVPSATKKIMDSMK